jgi:hypothetical protein
MTTLPHTRIKKIFPNIYFITGTNITNFNNTNLQHSRNMIIIKNKNKLSLINTVKLNEEGLQQLEELGEVENIIRIGAFHGRDDIFYLNRYQAKLWSLPTMQHENNRITDYELTPTTQLPFPNSSLLFFPSSTHPEAIIHLTNENGILITCDSIKNWITPDEFFSDETATLYQQQNFFGTATISPVWLQACKIKLKDFSPLKKLQYHHLLSAHGEPLLNNAKEKIEKTMAEMEN